MCSCELACLVVIAFISDLLDPIMGGHIAGLKRALVATSRLQSGCSQTSRTKPGQTHGLPTARAANLFGKRLPTGMWVFSIFWCQWALDRTHELETTEMSDRWLSQRKQATRTFASSSSATT